MAEANLTGSLAPESICGAIQQLHQVCHGHGIRTVALPIPPNKFTTLQSAEFEEYQKLWRRTNELLFAWASETPQTVWFDVTKELPWSETDGCWEADGLHLAPAGSEKLGNLLGSHPMVRQWLLEGCATLSYSSVRHGQCVLCCIVRHRHRSLNTCLARPMVWQTQSLKYRQPTLAQLGMQRTK